MISFLSKLGKLIVEGASVVAGFAPMLSAVDPKNSAIIQTVSADLAAMANIVLQVEVASQASAENFLPLTGPQKLQMAAALVKPILIQSNIIAGRKIADPALLDKAAMEFAQGIVDALQSIHPDVASTMVTAKLNVA